MVGAFLRALAGLLRELAMPVAAFGFVGLAVLALATGGFGMVDDAGAGRDVGSGGGGGEVSVPPTISTTTPVEAQTHDLEADQDGDRLPDSQEGRENLPTELPLWTADPERKDLYIVLAYSEGVKPLGYAEQEELAQIWADMPVDNPSGEDGVSLHIADEMVLDETVTLGEFREGRGYELYRAHARTADGCLYHLVVLGDSSGSEAAGLGYTPGYLTFVDGAYGGDQRVELITHELLHNVVGPLPEGAPGVTDDGSHTTEGWLAQGELSRSLHPVTENKLDEGFASTEGYRLSYC